MIWLHLPLHLWALVACNLSISSFTALLSTSKEVRANVDTVLVWSEKFRRDFRSEEKEVVEKRKEIKDWRALYQHFHANKLVFTMQVNPTSFTKKEEVRIMCTLKNISTQPMRIALGKNKVSETPGWFMGKNDSNIPSFHRIVDYSQDNKKPYKNLVTEEVFTARIVGRLFLMRFGFLFNEEQPLVSYYKSEDVFEYDPLRGLTTVSVYKGKLMSNTVMVKLLENCLPPKLL